MKVSKERHDGSIARFVSLRTKFVVFISLIIVAVCSGLSWYFIEQQGQSLMRGLTDTGVLLVKNLAHNSRYATIIEDETGLEKFIDGVMENDEVVYAVITRRDESRLIARTKGQLVERTGLRSPFSPLYPDPSLVRPLLDAPTQDPLVTHFTAHGRYADETIFDFTVPILRQPPQAETPLPFSLESSESRQKTEDVKSLPTVVSVVQIGLTDAKRQQALREAVRKVVLSTFTIILLGIAATGLLANRIITPLKQLATVARRVAEGDWDATAEPTTHDEVGQLTLIFNQMTQSLKERDVAISSQIQTITKQVTQLATLNRVGTAITSTLDIDKLLHAVLQLLVENVGFVRMRLVLFDADRGLAFGSRMVGVPEEIERLWRHMEIPVVNDGSYLAELLIQGKPMLVTDVAAIQDRMADFNRIPIQQIGITSFVSAPLKIQHEILGYIGGDRGDVACTQEDLELIVTIASHLAVALGNAQAYQKLARFTQTLEQRVKERTQELVTANEKLLELDRLKSAFVSVVSHELRTPMTSIKGYVENMLDGLTGDLTERQSYYLSRVKFNIERLTRMINDLLDLSRIEAGRVELTVAPIPVGDFVAEITESLQPLAHSKGVILRSRFHGEPMLMYADRDKLYQILTNLIQNAVKFTPKSGEVQLEVSIREDGLVQFCVMDTGCGIAPHELTRIFDRFYRGESVQNEQRGAGLGLAITKSLVELHGGTIRATSVLGQGSRFFFTIPIMPSSPRRQM
ncbi:MAG: HAMP domain-containing protein [Nitrospiraceae bacterium]|nr:HAMP domain-containing protein [Nitrospiraceae bacterium]